MNATTTTRRAKRTCIALALAATIGGGATAGAADLVVWHAYRGGEKDAFEKVVAAYNAQNAAKGVKVSTLAVPYDAFADKITAAVPRGKGPDVFIYAQDRLGGWVEAGNTIEPIDFYLDQATSDRFVPSTLEAMTYHGSVYGLPLNFKVLMHDLQQEAGEDPAQDLGRAGGAGQEADQSGGRQVRSRLLVRRLLLPRRADERLRRRRLRRPARSRR